MDKNDDRNRTLSAFQEKNRALSEKPSLIAKREMEMLDGLISVRIECILPE